MMSNASLNNALSLYSAQCICESVLTFIYRHLHLRPYSSSAWQHTSTYGSEACRGFGVRRHTTPRLESPSWQTTDYMDESDRAGHRTHCCWLMGYRWRPVNVEGATTHSRLCAAVSEWLTYWETKIHTYKKQSVYPTGSGILAGGS